MLCGSTSIAWYSVVSSSGMFYQTRITFLLPMLADACGSADADAADDRNDRGETREPSLEVYPIKALFFFK